MIDKPIPQNGYVMRDDLFDNYQNLFSKVEEFRVDILQTYGEHVLCKYGCTECCQQNLSLFPIEFYFLWQGFTLLPESIKRSLRYRVSQGIGKDSSCLLLHEEGCLLYDFRPIICRTHGLPLSVFDRGQERRDCCPKNFAEYSLELLPKRDLLNLERLNTILVAINVVFTYQAKIESGIRLSMAELVA
ncbi:MAG: YkgJ family cysteine cluster protein [Pseudomonadota bacterium]